MNTVSFAKLLAATAALIAVLLIAAGMSAYGAYKLASEEHTCLKCHSQREACDRWAGMAHDSISCRSCHDGAMNSTWHVATHSFDLAMHPDKVGPEKNIRLDEEQMLAIDRNCRNCHETAYAEWASSGHGTTYAKIFLNEEHNKMEMMADRCLVCHGMFFDGNTADLVRPLDTDGPWELCEPAMADWPAIPCLACHQVHAEHYPAPNPDYSDPAVIAARPKTKSTTLGFYSRSGHQYLSVEDLPPVTMRDGAERVVVSVDVKQRACYQCHAPNSRHEIGTSDDRTPTGVHQGLSCLACHSPHGSTLAESCSGCHKPETEDRLRRNSEDPAQSMTVH